MVACSQPLAAEAGYSILRQGGNAVDAAVAMAACLNVTEPCSTGIGGDAFLLFYDAKTKEVRGLNGSGRAPAALSLEQASREAGGSGKGGMVPTHVHCVTVPGAAALWVDAVDQLGSMPLATVLAPAIRLAEDGYPVSTIAAGMWAAEEARLLATSPSGKDMLLPNGAAPKAGQIMRMPKLAKYHRTKKKNTLRVVSCMQTVQTHRTFRGLAQFGKDGFYKGPVAEAVVNAIKSKGGMMELSDLAAHSTETVVPIHVDYEGRLRMYEIPPNGQGITALIALKILEYTPAFQNAAHNSPLYIHLLTEALRIAFSDTRHFVADPAVVHVPTQELLSDAYLRSRASLIDPSKPLTSVQHGSPVASGDTVYFCVVDEQGNACSFINSNYMVRWFVF